MRPPLFVAVLALAAPVAAWSQSSADAEAGRRAFMEAGCYQCHGTVGQGGVGPKLAPGALPAVALIAFVRNTSGNMPPYSAKVLSDDDLRRIAAYLASIGPAPDKH
jgi:ubiquinol-cytochrome c reductase cytochrome c subunit